MGSPIFPIRYRTNSVQFTAAGAVTQVLYAAGAAGARVHKISATQDDAVLAVMRMFKGRVLTDNGRPYAGWRPDEQTMAPTPGLAITNTTNSTITRSNGSFLTDGWNVGMLLAVNNSTDNVQNQIAPAHVTAVTATTLTFTGAVFNAAAASPNGGLQLIRCEPLWNTPMTSGAGYTSGIAAVDLLAAALDPGILAQPNNFYALGAGDLLLVSCGTLPSANKCIAVNVSAGEYA